VILLKNCFRVMTPLPGHSGTEPDQEPALADLSGVDIAIDKNRIVRIGKGIAAELAVPGSSWAKAKVIDASRHVVTPGLVNTHHHFYQTLTRSLPAVQQAKLFDWLVYLYEVWKYLDEEAVYWSSKLAIAELLKTGCTLSTDHHYLYPQGFKEDLPGLQFKAASELGIRFAPTRGSMSRSKKDGGLPPDSTVQDEDTILADSEAAILKYHDPADDAMRKIALAPCSPFSVSERSMLDAAELARKHAVRLHTHLAETSDEDDFCMDMYGRRPLRLMEDCGFVGSDVSYAHGIYFNDEELDVLAKTGTGVAHCASSNMRTGSGICRVREMLDKGVPVALGVDGAAAQDCSDMLGEVRQAMLLQRVRYGAGGLSAREALGMATEGGARMLGYSQAGKIEVGALADIALFDVMNFEYAGGMLDPVAALVFCGYDHGADHVIVNGVQVVEQGRLLFADEDTLRDEANRIADRLYRKAGIV
jgi:8-oxoguanine deaminase